MGLNLSFLRNKQALEKEKAHYVSFGQLVTKARAGDLILIQDDVYFDNYTIMNTQRAHHMKHLLRFRCKES